MPDTCLNCDGDGCSSCCNSGINQNYKAPKKETPNNSIDIPDHCTPKQFWYYIRYDYTVKSRDNHSRWIIHNSENDLDFADNLHKWIMSEELTLGCDILLNVIKRIKPPINPTYFKEYNSNATSKNTDAIPRKFDEHTACPDCNGLGCYKCNWVGTICKI